MRKGFRILLVVSLLSGACGLAWLALSEPREPVYQGKRLSEWLHGYDHPGMSPGSATRQLAADEAMEHIGTDAIPFLLQRLREHDSSLKFRLLRLLEKQHFVKISYTPAEVLNMEAREAFGILGASASNAVPRLIKIFSRNFSPESQNATAFSLGFIGPAASNAVPVLLQCACAGQTAADANYRDRGAAILALGQIHAQPATVVPALTEMLREHDSGIRYWAACALGIYGPDAKSAVPLLIQCYHGASVQNQIDDIGGIIKKIDPEAATKATVQ
jgi:HEAT repeat protein